MAKIFSLASWNVKHFMGKPARVSKVIDFVRDQKPDIFSILEVEGKDVYADLVSKMPKYQFHITEGPQTQEILVGVKSGFTAFFTQKVEFKTGNKYLRPGALLTVNINNENYSILFLHIKSNTEPLGLGIRDDQFRRACKLKRILGKAAGGRNKPNTIILGDFNTMGMEYPYDRAIKAKLEIKRLKSRASRSGMRLPQKTSPTWWNGPCSTLPPSDLDQVLASKHLKFKKFNSSAEVDVRGWPKQLTPEKQKTWIENCSDHGLVYLVLE